MPSSEMPSSKAKEGQIKVLFVTRLRRLIRMRKEYREDLNPLGFRLLDRAIDATFQDCIDYGAGDEAKAILAERR